MYESATKSWKHSEDTTLTLPPWKQYLLCLHNCYDHCLDEVGFQMFWHLILLHPRLVSILYYHHRTFIKEWFSFVIIAIKSENFRISFTVWVPTPESPLSSLFTSFICFSNLPSNLSLLWNSVNFFLIEFYISCSELKCHWPTSLDTAAISYSDNLLTFLWSRRNNLTVISELFISWPWNLCTSGLR